MKYIYFIILSFGLFGVSSSQVGIGTIEPHDSSMLDITSTNKGLLIPRVNLTSTSIAAPVVNPIESILVYNENIAGDVTKGFYYWTGFEWKPLISTGGSVTSGGWGLGGNNAAANDFIGTNNARPLVIKTNGVERTRITTKGQIVVSNTGKSVFLGQENGENDDLQNRINIFIGSQAGKSNRGSDNVAIGEQALSKDGAPKNNIAIGKSAAKLNTGSNNIAIGESALSKDNGTSNNIAIGQSAGKGVIGGNNIILGELALSKDGANASNNIVFGKSAALGLTGNYNIVLGESALSKDGSKASNNIVMGKNAGLKNTGDYNIILGENNLSLDKSGSNNVLVGFEAGKNLENNNNTFVGYKAGTVAGNFSNSLALGANTVVSASNQVVIGDVNIMEVKTTGKLNIGVAGTNYILPKTRGANGQVLKTDGAGNVTWQSDNVAALRAIDFSISQDIEALRDIITTQQTQLDNQQKEINELKNMLLQVINPARD